LQGAVSSLRRLMQLKDMMNAKWAHY
jgi:hypothetical protein